MRNPLAELWYEAQTVDSEPSSVVGVEQRAVVEAPAPAPVGVSVGVPAAAEAEAVPSAAGDGAVPPTLTPAPPTPTPVDALAAVHQSTDGATPPAEATDVSLRAATSAIDFIYAADVAVPRAAEVSIQKMFTASHPASDTPVHDRHGPIPCEELDVSRSMPANDVALKCGEACAEYEDCRAFWCASLPSIFAA